MKKLLIDLCIVAVSIIAAIYIVHSGAIEHILAMTGDRILLTSLVAGLFFTSVFTTAPAIAVLGSLSHHGNIFIIAAVGGVGAVLGDYILFWFVRDHITKDASALMKGRRWRGVRHILRNRMLRRLLPIIGAFIVASPFPDEVGLALMGVSKLSTGRFLLIAYCMNALGILAIGFVAQIL